MTWEAVTWSSWYPNLCTSPGRWPLTPVSWLPCTHLRLTKTNTQKRAKMYSSLIHTRTHTHHLSVCITLSLMSNHTDTQHKVTHSSLSVYVYGFSWVMRRDCWDRISSWSTKNRIYCMPGTSIQKNNMAVLHLVLSAGSHQAKERTCNSLNKFLMLFNSQQRRTVRSQRSQDFI